MRRGGLRSDARVHGKPGALFQCRERRLRNGSHATHALRELHDGVSGLGCNVHHERERRRGRRLRLLERLHGSHGNTVRLSVRRYDERHRELWCVRNGMHRGGECDSHMRREHVRVHLRRGLSSLRYGLREQHGRGHVRHDVVRIAVSYRSARHDELRRRCVLTCLRNGLHPERRGVHGHQRVLHDQRWLRRAHGVHEHAGHTNLW